MFKGLLAALVLFGPSVGLAQSATTAPSPMAVVDSQIAAHPGQTGVVVLDTGEEALLARAWLADHAQRSIEVQYFIWSTDNIGILASEALLRAAERGVKAAYAVKGHSCEEDADAPDNAAPPKAGAPAEQSQPKPQ